MAPGFDPNVLENSVKAVRNDLSCIITLLTILEKKAGSTAMTPGCPGQTVSWKMKLRSLKINKLIKIKLA